MSRKIIIIKVLLITALITFFSQTSSAKEPLGKQWPSSKQISIDDIKHDEFDRILKKYVDENGYVDYKSFKNSSKDRKSLNQYLSHLSQASRQKKATHEAKIAFWINAYNAVTLEGILQVYPTTSIRNHTAKLFGYNIWKELPLIVGSQQYSLEQIEHQILRKMNEPRIHFAIVCASIGCPRLFNQAFVAEKIDSQLSENARDFFSRKTNFKIDRRNKTVYFSSILDWFGSDFGNSDAAILKKVQPYFPDRFKNDRQLTTYHIRHLSYNWKLNDQSSLSK